MFSLEFLLTSFIVVLVPGTGVVYAVSTGLIQGRRAAVFAALGGVAGIVPHLIEYEDFSANLALQLRKALRFLAIACRSTPLP